MPMASGGKDRLTNAAMSNTVGSEAPSKKLPSMSTANSTFAATNHFSCCRSMPREPPEPDDDGGDCRHDRRGRGPPPAPRPRATTSRPRPLNGLSPSESSSWPGCPQRERDPGDVHDDDQPDRPPPARSGKCPSGEQRQGEPGDDDRRGDRRAADERRPACNRVLWSKAVAVAPTTNSRTVVTIGSSRPISTGPMTLSGRRSETTAPTDAKTAT